jgi:hypothetical protein
MADGFCMLKRKATAALNYITAPHEEEEDEKEETVFPQ